MEIIDTHAHLDMPEFDADREKVIASAIASGVTKIITVGIDLQSSRKAIELSEKYPAVWASIGVHPQESKNIQKDDIDNLASLARHPRVVAVGETGLDYYRNYSPKDIQLSVFQWELDMAQKVGLPIIIHCRQAQAEMLAILQNQFGSCATPDERPRGVIHCFSGDQETAEKYLKLGFIISLGAYIGYPSSARLRETIRNIPITKLVLETDCPFLPPQKFRGQRNEPSYAVITLGILAEIKQISLEEVAQQTTLNAAKLFNLPRQDQR